MPPIPSDDGAPARLPGSESEQAPEMPVDAAAACGEPLQGGSRDVSTAAAGSQAAPVYTGADIGIYTDAVAAEDSKSFTKDESTSVI